MIGELWILPCLIALTTMPAGGKGWERYALTTLISGCTYIPSRPVPARHLADGFRDAARPLLPPDRLLVGQRELVLCQKAVGCAVFLPITCLRTLELTYLPNPVSLVTYNVVVQMGSVISSQLFRADDAPWCARIPDLASLSASNSFTTLPPSQVLPGHEGPHRHLRPVPRCVRLHVALLWLPGASSHRVAGPSPLPLSLIFLRPSRPPQLAELAEGEDLAEDDARGARRLPGGRRRARN
jgi:hypothetical protein